MELMVNGERRDVAAGIDLAALVRETGADPDQTATLVNDELVPAARRAATVLVDGARVELLTFAGGG